MPRSRFCGSTVVMVDHERRLLPFVISKWWLCVWATTSVLAVVALAESRPFGSGEDLFHVAPATGRIHDSFGRERIFHGLNVVVKGAPWHPLVDAFDPQYSFTDADIALVKAWGMNVVRLGIMWPGVEPSRGTVNSTYLELMRSIVGKLHAAGIYTVLEFHQDLYASQFCGEGLPSWTLDDSDLSQPLVHMHQRQHPSLLPLHNQQAPNERRSSTEHNDLREERKGGAESNNSSNASTSSRLLIRRQRQIPDRKPHFQNNNNMMMMSTKMRYPASFPEPLGKRWPWPSEWEKDGWEPPIERCNSHAWWLFYLSYAVSRAFQDLYDNKWGWRDLLARYWTVVAGAFKDQPGVLGYELMNEPWPGDVFSNPLLFLPGVADKKNLAPFYDKLQAAVRAVDSERILFFETITFDNFRCGWSTVPGGAQWQNKTVLSYHYYTPPNFSAKQAFAERSRESKRLGCGSMLTEFFVSTEQDRRDQEDFRKARSNMLRNALGTEVILDPKSRADKEDALFSDPAEETSSDDEMCDKESRRASQEDLETMYDFPAAKEEEMIEVEEEVAYQSLYEFTTIDKKASARKVRKRTTHRRKFEREDAKAPANDLKKSQGAPLASDGENLNRTRASDVDSVDGVLSAADTYVQSWIGWEYKAFFHKTGSIAKQSLFNEDGELDGDLAKKLGRTYPRSVCGNIVSFSFDPPSSLFSFSYVAGRDCRAGNQLAFTEIFIQREYYYPNGLLIEVHPPCASFTETNWLVQIKHTAHCFGYVIDVRLSRIDSVS